MPRDDDGIEICMVCGAATRAYHSEAHHFPSPKMLGGIETITLCLACHDMVYRINLKDWPVDALLEGWHSLPRFGKLMVMKLIERLNPTDTRGL